MTTNNLVAYLYSNGSSQVVEVGGTPPEGYEKAELVKLSGNPRWVEEAVEEYQNTVHKDDVAYWEKKVRARRGSMEHFVTALRRYSPKKAYELACS